MRNPNGRATAVGQILAILVITLGIVTPVSAQFGALKKKLKGEAATKAATAAVGPDAPAPTESAAAPAATPEDNSTIVLTSEAVDRLLAGLRAGQAEREKAAKEDTPYGQYLQAKAAYDVAKPKCDQAQQTWPTRLAADEKLMKRNQALLDKMIAAAQKQDQKTQQIYADSMLGFVDASCLVKQPQQPNDYWDAQRALDTRAEQAVLETSGFSARQYGEVTERVTAILQGTEVPGGASASEKSAVSAKDPELKSLLGIRTAQEGRIAKQAPAPAPAPVVDSAPTPTAAPAPSGGMAAMNACMAANAQKYQRELEGLGAKAQQAQKVKDQATLIAVADSAQKLQMRGCGAGY